ncbi:hypothetical protein BOVATA_035420 [Babesia ovata]|uniref:Uncharacterized protein n=1 Tax=Babesia ovata TaxID=189622 RepID=A0A2H6KGF8_9APIC|nr:uncharacterized protein BOVATA_035420 [Babesia ovata]GBE62049.1 hypothetical protein BOVATA_035420 [Babesia ovata]
MQPSCDTASNAKTSCIRESREQFRPFRTISAVFTVSGCDPKRASASNDLTASRGPSVPDRECSSRQITATVEASTPALAAPVAKFASAISSKLDISATDLDTKSPSSSSSQWRNLDGVREVVPRVKRVVVDHGLVVVVNFDKSLGQLLAVAHLDGEIVSLVLPVARDGRTDNVHQRSKRGVNATEKGNSHDESTFTVIPEAFEHGSVVLVELEQVEDGKQLREAVYQHLCDMVALPVAHLVGGNGDNLRLRLLEERVVHHDLLEPPQSVEVHVGVVGTLGAVHQLNLTQRELKFPGKILNALLKFLVLQGLKFVEQRGNQIRVDDHHEQVEERREEADLATFKIHSIANLRRHRTNRHPSSPGILRC